MSRLANRTSRLRRLEELLYLKPGGLRVTEISERLDVHRRTVYRDLDFLCEQGVPVWQENGCFGLNRARYVSTVHLSFHESIALVLAGLLLSRSIDEHNPHVAAALRKLATTLPRPLTPHLRRAAERVQTRNGGQHVPVLEAIAEGWANGRKVEVGYRSPRSGTLRPRILHPYALEPTPSGIYVIGYEEWAEDLRTFKLDRLDSAVVLQETFEAPDDFDLEAYLGSGWRIMAGDEVQAVVLRFSAEVEAHVAERTWHPSQQLEPLEEGGCLLRISVAEPLEMQPWIRSWGAQVEVLSPAWLRAKIAEELREAAEKYGD
ncbi:MAG TPA: transcriptional regulator [Candidatus Sulfomarinibacteraceae bacterium]|nr:transcriptional regulator [Candidatus Sulfomarinibacteraceae bacterium]